MNLFEINDTGEPILSPISYELKAIKKLITRDKDKNKKKAKAEIAFIWFYTDYKSDFSSIVDEKRKLSEIKTILGLSDSWKPDKAVKDAIEFYKEITKTPATLLLNNTKRMVERLSIFTDSIDFAELDGQGKLKYDMKKVIDSTNQVPKLLATLKEIETRVKEEQEEIEQGIRGDKELAVWEDGIDDL